MAERFQKLRAMGEVGTWLANILAFASANWVVLMSTLIGFLAWLWNSLFEIASNPRVEIGVGVFLAVLWTAIGVATLVDRRKPRTIIPAADYRYGLVLEGFSALFVSANFPILPGALQFSIQLRNFSPNPIKYSFENVDIRIGSRFFPKYKIGTLNGYMARGSGRTARPESLTADNLKEFYGKGETRGSAEISVCYGPPDGPPERRLKITMELIFVFPNEGIVDPMKGSVFIFTENILSEEDEAIKTL